MKRRVVLRALAAAPLSAAMSPCESKLAAPEPIRALLWHESQNDLKAFEGFARGCRVLRLPKPTLLRVDRDAERAQRELRAAERAGAPLVLALGTRAALTARTSLKRTPLVFTAVTHPVLSGVVPSWEGSGARVAGNSNWLDRREMMRAFLAAAPGMRRLGVIATKGNAVSAAEIEEAERALDGGRGPELVTHLLEPGETLDEKLPALLKRVDALWLPIDFALYQDEPLARIVALTRRAGVPLMSSSQRAAGKGALVVVAVDYQLLGLRAAAIARRILKGDDPSRMPVGRLTSSRLYVDLEAARAIQRELPLDLLLRAWRVFGRTP